MKTLKPYDPKIYKYYLPFILSFIVVLVIIPKLFEIISYITLFFLFAAFILILTPFGNKKLAPHTANSSKKSKNILLLMLLQISIFVLIIGIMSFYIRLNPIPYLSISPISLMNSTLHDLFLKWGLFPWSLYTLVAIYYLQCSEYNNVPSLTSLISPILSNQKGVLSFIAEVFPRQSILFGSGAILGMFALWLYILISKLLHIPVYTYLDLTNLFIISMGLVLTNTTFWNNYVNRLWRKRISTGKIHLVYMLVIIVFLLLANPLAQQLNFTDIQLPMHQLISNLQGNKWGITWPLFFVALLISLAPLIAPLQAKLLRGFSIRSAICISLFLPALMAIAYLNYSVMPKILTDHWLQYLFAFCAYALVFVYFYSTKIFDDQIIALTYKDNKSFNCVTGKKRVPLIVIRGSLKIMMILSMFYLLGGIFLLGTYFFAVTSAAALVYIVYILFGLTRILIEKPKTKVVL